MVRHDDLRRLELEMGVLMRRLKRALHERAALVHPDLQPAAYIPRPKLNGRTLHSDDHAPQRSVRLV